MCSKKYVNKTVESATSDLQKKGLIIGGGLLAVTMLGDLIGGLRTNSTRRAVVNSLDGIDAALERIEGSINPAQPKPEKNEASEGSENGPSKGGTK